MQILTCSYCPICGYSLLDETLGFIYCEKCNISFLPYINEKDNTQNLLWKIKKGKQDDKQPIQ